MSGFEFITEEVVSVVEKKFGSLRKNNAYAELAHHVLGFLVFDYELRSFYFAWKARDVTNHEVALPDGTTLHGIEFTIKFQIAESIYHTQMVFRNTFSTYWERYTRHLYLQHTDSYHRTADAVKSIEYNEMPTEKTILRACRELYIESKKHAKPCLSCGILTLLPCDFCKDCVTITGKTRCQKCGQCSGRMKNGFHKVCKKLFKKRRR